LIALHACDTATDDAIAKGVKAGAKVIIVAPCCHKELSAQLVAPTVLAPALKHGILHEREAEFVTDALRAALLEWAGYETKVFEFISTEHTAKNLMITAMKRGNKGNERPARALATFYAIRRQRLRKSWGSIATMTWDALDWQALDRLRTTFLSEEKPRIDYWKSRSDLEKLRLHLRPAYRVEMGGRACRGEAPCWKPPSDSVLDWGCGSGVAGRIVRDSFGLRTLRVYDRSRFAMDYAVKAGNASAGVKAIRSACLS